MEVSPFFLREEFEGTISFATCQCQDFISVDLSPVNVIVLSYKCRHGIANNLEEKVHAGFNKLKVTMSLQLGHKHFHHMNKVGLCER